jgi:hypothetical protein
MAREIGSATNIGDLVNKLCTFASGLTTTPWTIDEVDITTNLRATMHRGSCYVSFRWSSGGNQLAIYQSLGFTGGGATLPHQQPDDSGNGTTTFPPTTGRRVNFTNGAGATNAGSYQRYDFFAGEGSQPYIYVAVEMVVGVYRHFGFGNLVKANDYTGGEFCFGHVWETTTNSDVPTATAHNLLLDGFGNVLADQATVHLEGFPGQAVGGKWGVCFGTSSTGTDRASVARLQLFGGGRSGLYGYQLGWMRASQAAAHKLMLPVPLLLRSTAATPHTWKYLGEMPGIRHMNMHHFAPKDEISVGADTYAVFPWTRKQKLDANTEESWNAGVAYKVT